MNIVVLSGAGTSKESGIETFRDSKDSLWNNHDIMEVASISGWRNDRELVSPACDLVYMKKYNTECYYIDPNPASNTVYKLEEIPKTAVEGVKDLNFLLD